MNGTLKLIDGLFNRFTMYKVITPGLVGLLAIAELFALTGVISISAVGLALTLAISVISCFAANYLVAKLFHAAWNTESWLITALILTCILPQATTLKQALLVALTGVIAMLSKYVLVFRGTHVFNPAGVAALIMGVGGLLGATWWIATPALTPFTIILGLIVLRKQRNFSLFLAFALAALVIMLLVGGLQSQPLHSILYNGFISFPLIFLGTIMLTEPTTLPPTRYYQLLFGVVVGAVFTAQLHAGRLSTTPEAALIAGNIFALLVVPSVGLILKLKQTNRLAPDIYEFVFAKQSGKRLPFAAGQYMDWTLPHKVDLRGNRRSFSLASAPTEDEVRIAIRTYDRSSSFKKALTGLAEGKLIRAAHVAGSFTLTKDTAQSLLFIAGGIGITPFRSMVKQLVDQSQKRDIVLVYVANDEQSFVYKDVWTAAEPLGLQTHYKVGRLSYDELTALVPDISRRTTYISGPDAMVTAYKRGLQAGGVKKSHIKTDHFTGY